MVNDSIKLRCIFSKTDRAIYISHLDLYTSMQRAFKRAKIPLWYTQGFNPHAYIMFPLALSLGVHSSVEIMDFNITEKMNYEDIKDKLNSVLPDGLHINSVFDPVKKHTEIGYSQYHIILGADVNDIESSFTDFINQDKIEVEKKTKRKGVALIDIKPYINVVSKEKTGKDLNLKIILPSGVENNINTTLVTDAFGVYINDAVEVNRIERTKILSKDKTEFF